MVEILRSFEGGRRAEPRKLTKTSVEQRVKHDAVTVNTDLVGGTQDLPHALEIDLDAGHMRMRVAVRKVLHGEVNRAPRRLADGLSLSESNLRVVDAPVR